MNDVAGISPLNGFCHEAVFMFLAHNQLIFIEQAQVLATSVLKDIIIPVVQAAKAGVIVTTQVSFHVALAQAYNHSHLWIVVAIISGVVDKRAPVQPVLVHAVISACVAISTLPATVVLAFGVLPVALSTHAPPT